MQTGLAAAASSMLPRAVRAQGYPTRPVRWVVPFPPGGPTDILARPLGQWLSERLGQPFIIENRPGAGATIGTEVVARSPGDGHTLLLVSTTAAINATLYDKLSYNFLRDMAPVAGIMRVSNVMLVTPSLPVHSVPELVAYAKANPNKINVASAGNGTANHVAGELFKMMTGIEMVHVPYRGSGPALTDLIAGQVHVMFDVMSSSIEHIRGGRLRPLAVTTATRSAALPDVPSVAEFVPGYEASAWYGVAVPRSTPGEIVELLNREINAGIEEPRMRARLAALGGVLIVGSPGDFEKLIAAETEKWAKVVRASGAKPD